MKDNKMSIEVNIKINSKNQVVCIDLMNHINNFNSFINELYAVSNTNTQLYIEDLSVVDTEYFNAFHEVQQFLSIQFDNENYALPFVVWCEMYNEQFNDYSKFKTVFKGLYLETKQFAKEYIEHNLNIPQYILECVDWQKVWDTHLSNELKAIPIENDMDGDTSIYTNAIFSKS